MAAAGISVASALRHHSAALPRSAAGHGSSPSATKPTTTVESASLVAQELNGLLTADQQNRPDVQTATDEIGSCSNLGEAVQVLQQVAAARQTLLGQLASVDVSGLPSGSVLAQELTSAWKASLTSDNSYAAWGQDEERGSCTPGDHGDSNFQAAQTTDAEATSAKSAFVNTWNPIAANYGLPQRQPDEL